MSETVTEPVVPVEPVAPAPKPEPPKHEGLPDDPAALRAEIAKLRRENGAERTTAKATAADEARKELAQQIGKALGLVEDDSADPAKLTERLTAQTTAAQQARVELAVFRAATAANGDPAALLDSTSFLRSLDGIDPTDTAAVQAAITAAVEANPRLGAAPSGPRPPAPNPAQGTGATGPGTPAQLTEQDVKRLYAAKDYDAIEAARSEGRLSKLLGG